jgi:LacI family transcriptional regulator
MTGRATNTKVTQKTIAEAAGLAITTVSKALAGDPKIASETREKVERIAREIGYTPDRAAQRLRTGKTRVFSLILNPHTELLDFANAMIVGVTQALEKSDYHLVVTPQFGDGDITEPIKHIVRNNLADGVIFSRVQPLDPRVKYLLEMDVPFVCHGRTNFSTPHAFVDFDNEEFIKLAVEKLHADGVRKICVISPPESLTFHQHVTTGTIKATNRLGIDHVFAQGVTLDSSLKEISAWATQVANSRDRPDGFIFLGEASYFAAMNAFRKSGLVRGRDFNVVVKRNSELINHIDPGVSVVFEDIVEAGRKMGNILLKQVKSSHLSPMKYIELPTKVETS